MDSGFMSRTKCPRARCSQFSQFSQSQKRKVCRFRPARVAEMRSTVRQPNGDPDTHLGFVMGQLWQNCTFFAESLMCC